MHRLLTAIAVVIAVAISAGLGAVAADAYTGPTWTLSGSEVTSNVSIKSKDVGGLTLEDSGTGAAIECKITDEGTIGPEGKGKITSISTSACKTLKVCQEGEIVAKAVHLPWNTQLEEVEASARDKISSSGAGAPGWSVECLVLGIKTKDECTGETTVDYENVAGGVNLVYDSESSPSSCLLGGAGTGLALGVDLDESPAGKQLAGRAVCKFKHTHSITFEGFVNETLPVVFTNEGESTIEVTSEKIDSSEVELGKFVLPPEGPSCIGVLITTGKTCEILVELAIVTGKEATYLAAVTCLALSLSGTHSVPLKN